MKRQTKKSSLTSETNIIEYIFVNFHLFMYLLISLFVDLSVHSFTLSFFQFIYSMLSALIYCAILTCIHHLLYQLLSSTRTLEFN